MSRTTNNRLQMHSFVAAIHGSFHSMGSWKHKYNETYDTRKTGYWKAIAQVAERGKFDSIFIADNLAAYDTYEDSCESTIENGVQFPQHDPLLHVPLISEVTDNLGIAVTMSATYYQPYLLARKLSTLDHITNGRIGWNIVTSLNDNEAKNMGLNEVIPHDQRYERADEYMRVVGKLWNSWKGDPTKGESKDVYADADDVPRIDHDGHYFTIPGPFPVTPSPQGKPVYFQAGQSDRGREFAAQHAEAIFTAQPTDRIDLVQDYVNDIRKRAKNKNRNPENISIIQSVLPIIGETEESAQNQLMKIKDMSNYESGMALLSGHTNHDFSQYDPDKPISKLDVEGSQGMLEMIVDSNHETLREAATQYGIGSHHNLTGTPKQIADSLETLADEGGVDGFNIIELYRPGTLFDFVEKVIPILQERNRVRMEYTGNTFRDNLRS
ncbi:LLM class flavin-dependent oxidoreductase [Natrinema halophilum]|uniref:LLM class flavin-dependent oxidoreductase n=1 Tax=Natrinema halophilum TaxID=1699371 RepID=UPI001F3C9660|nr:LLM class flavin-dependent oxidoreductase [Natrinema halophilum]UHQ96215.1 LLM class flavin-dependent oxidoreductase [Natrinema halophilum]